jgi:hypothetical protein
MKGVKATEKAVAGRLRADVNGDRLTNKHPSNVSDEGREGLGRPFERACRLPQIHGHCIPATAITSLGRSKGRNARLRLEGDHRYPPSESGLEILSGTGWFQKVSGRESLSRRASFVSWLVA